MEAEVNQTPTPSSPVVIMLASAGKPFHRDVIQQALELGRGRAAVYHVLSIAHIWGTALGLQHPGLLPNKREWAEQRDLVAAAVSSLKRAGREAHGGVIASRNASKTITREAKRRGCDAIVIGAPQLSWWMNALLQDEARWVSWRSKVPVVQVPC